MVKLNYGLYFTLNNGYKSLKEIEERDIEGLNLGFLDVHEIIDIDWVRDDNDFDESVYVEEWYIEKLKDEDVIELDI